MVGLDAAPAASPRKRRLGRPRGPGRAALRPLCEELAGLGLAHTVAERRRPRPRKPGPWTEIAAMERRPARTPLAKECLPKGSIQRRSAVRRSVPFGLAEGGNLSPRRRGSEDRLPRAANNRGDDACSNFNPSS